MRRRRETMSCAQSETSSEVYGLMHKFVSLGPPRQVFALPDSDVDLAVFGAARGSNVKKALYKLAGVLRRKGLVEYIEVIARARIPIIKLRLNGCPYTADICFDQEGGIEAVDYIKARAKMYPSLRPLTLLIKYFLSQRDLNETFSGGIGSFLCTLTVMSVIQSAAASAPIDKHPQDLGTLLLKYLQLFGKALNYSEVVVRVKEPGGFTTKREKGWDLPGKRHFLSVENPLEPERDVATGAFAIGRVRRAFQNAYDTLCGALNQAIEGSRSDDHNLSLLGSIIQPDEMLALRYRKQLRK